jgi:predicted metallopeptidase
MSSLPGKVLVALRRSEKAWSNWYLILAEREFPLSEEDKQECIIHENAIIDPTKVDCIRVDNRKRAFRIGEEGMK